MQAVDGHPGSFQSAGKLVGEKDVCQLRLVVGALPIEVLLPLQVIEVYLPFGVVGSGDVDDSWRARCA